MRVIVDRLAWVACEELPPGELARLRHRLTIVNEDVSRTFVEDLGDGEYIGLPRQFFFDEVACAQDDVVDVSVDRALGDFPAFAGTLRDGQRDALSVVEAQLRKPVGSSGYGGLVEAPCGAGKTVTALALLSRLRQRALVLVHKTDLMKQWVGVSAEDAEDGRGYGIRQFLPGCRVGTVRQNTQDFEDAHITLATLQTVHARMQQLTDKGFFNHFGVVVVDEAHHVPAGTFEPVVARMNARYRFGLSATFRRRDGFAPVFYWHLGKTLVQMTAETVTGTYAQIGVETLLDEKQYTTWNGEPSVSRLISSLAECDARNGWIAEEIVRAKQAGRRVLFLTDRRKHVDALVQLVGDKLQAAGEFRSVAPYVGGMKDAELRVAKTKHVIGGTYPMFNEGVDAPEIDTLFLITPRSDVEQAVGRIQRICAGKRNPVVVDLVDERIGMCLGMARKRRDVYRRLGFESQKG